MQQLSLHVVGADHPNEDGGDRRFEILLCAPGEPIELVPEPKNPVDPNAIAVFSVRRIKIGYLTGSGALDAVCFAMVASFKRRSRKQRGREQRSGSGSMGKPRPATVRSKATRRTSSRRHRLPARRIATGRVTILRRKISRTALLGGGSTDGDGGADQQKAWAINAELIADLGAGDAVAWADDYMHGLHEKSDWRGMQRSGIVVSALDELASANVH